MITKSWWRRQTSGFEDRKVIVNALTRQLSHSETLELSGRHDLCSQSTDFHFYGNSKVLSEQNSVSGKRISQTVKNDVVWKTTCHGSVSTELQSYRYHIYRRMLTFGHELMREHEILELVIDNTGYRGEVSSLAKRLLDTFGDLAGVLAASKHRMLKVDGCTEDFYFQLRLFEAFAHHVAKSKIVERDIFDSWNSLMAYCRTAMAHHNTEQFRILFLDPKNVLISDEIQASGTFDHVSVYPREIAKRALELDASTILLIHNHPSGDTEPSQADLEMTNQVIRTCELVGVSVLDHIIISKFGETSFRTNGLL